MTKTLRSFRWLWDASAGFRARILLCAFLGSLRICASLTFVWLSKVSVDEAAHIAGSSETRSLFLKVGAMLLCALIQLVCSAARNRLSVKVEICLRNGLRHRLLDHILRSRWTGRESFRTGDILTRMEGDVSSVSHILSSVIPAVWITLFQLAGAAFFLFALNASIAFAVILIMPVLLLLSKIYIRKMRRLTSEIRSTDSQLQSYLQENLQHKTLISAYEYAGVVSEGMDSLQSSLEKLVMKRNAISVFSASVVSLGFSLGYIVAFGWGAYGISAGAVTFGALTAFLQLVGQVQRPVVELGREIPTLVNALTAVDRLGEIDALPLEEQGEPLAVPEPAGLRFSNVTFSYPDAERPVIENFSFDFTPGSLTAVLGSTGAGKSTLVRLMLALLEPSSGTVELYSSNATAPLTVSPRTRGNFVYVPQGNSLITGTIRENLLLGDPGASDERMLQALHVAAAGFVYELPLGLDTPCGEMGAGLSEGQAQRIAIARALLRPGGIVLLDEPTSSLDSQTEQVLLQRLSQEISGKTLIVITHQSGTASFCDRTVLIPFKKNGDERS